MHGKEELIFAEEVKVANQLTVKSKIILDYLCGPRVPQES
jgi:hypothetical protein